MRNFTSDNRAVDVSQQLSEAILNGQYASGARLPSEGDLQRQFSVSRGVIREAIKILQSNGLARIEHGRGTFVCERDHSALRRQMEWALQGQPESLSTQATNAKKKTGGGLPSQWQHLLEVRRALEAPVAQCAAERATPEDLASLQNAIEALEANAASPDESARADLQFHRALAAATHNPLWTALMHSLNDLLQSSIETGYRDATAAQKTAREHRTILSAVQKRDGRAAARAMERHLASSETDLQEAIQTAPRKKTSR